MYDDDFLILKGKAIRVHVSSPNASENFPVLFVVKQQLGILSWQIPLFTDSRLVFNDICSKTHYYKINFFN